MDVLDVFDKTVDDILTVEDYEKLSRQYSCNFYVPMYKKGPSFNLLADTIGHEKASQLVSLRAGQWLQVDWRCLAKDLLSDVHDLAITKKIPISEISELKKMPIWRVTRALSQQSLALRNQQISELKRSGESSWQIAKKLCMNDDLVRKVLKENPWREELTPST
jgi:hypothetical protein